MVNKVQVFSLVFVFSQPIVSHIVVKIAEVRENSRGWRGEGGADLLSRSGKSRNFASCQGNNIIIVNSTFDEVKNHKSFSFGLLLGL